MDVTPPKILTETVEQVSIPLARVFSLSLKEGVVPFEWKETNIPFKKGSRNNSENYRPMSLTSVICKLLQRLSKDHMVDFLVKHKLLNPSPHGFLKVRSCLTNMLFFWKKSLSGLKKDHHAVDIIYLDFQKAFDKVPHQRLLLKLKAHGIGDSITDWIEQWLTDRRQCVVTVYNRDEKFPIFGRFPTCFAKWVISEISANPVLKSGWGYPLFEIAQGFLKSQVVILQTWANAGVCGGLCACAVGGTYN